MAGFAIVIMGAILFALVAFPISFAFSALSVSHAPAFTNVVLPFGIVAALTIWIATAAPTARIAWGRLFILAGLGGFALPLEGFVASLALNASTMAEHSGQLNTPGAHAGAAIGAGVTTLAVSGVTAFVGIFVGLIFVVVGYFTLRDARRPLRGL